MPRRCFIPSEYAFTRLPDAADRPTRSSASPMRRFRVRGSASGSAESSLARLAEPER